MANGDGKKILTTVPGVVYDPRNMVTEERKACPHRTAFYKEQLWAWACIGEECALWDRYINDCVYMNLGRIREESDE